MESNKVRLSVIKVEREQSVPTSDLLAVEKEFQLYLNEKPIASLFCSPLSLEELALGYLHWSDELSHSSEVQSVRIDEQKLEIKVIAHQNVAGQKTLFSKPATPLPEAENQVVISPQQILYFIKQLELQSTLFKETGGAHNAALCSCEKLLAFFEDVGRYNTLDKIYGHCLLKNIDPTDKLIIFSGRIAAKILRKVYKMGVPILVSRSAPTSLAVEEAERLGITVVGFARGNRLTVYTHPQRLSL